jgi:GntR family transcriptional regulator/MocR family aminotransferase
MVKRSRGMQLQSIVLERNSSQLLSAQIYRQLKERGLAGSLSPGNRLPSTRTMVSELGVARATIVETFERLVAEDLLESRVGAGTHVSQALNARVPPVDEPLDVHTVTSAKLTSAIAMATHFATRLTHKHWRNSRNQMLIYFEALGAIQLREAIATHLRVNRGILREPKQIFIVSGAHYAFQLIAEMLIDVRDTVWFENPGHIGARNCFMLGGANVVAIPVDDGGLQVE